MKNINKEYFKKENDKEKEAKIDYNVALKNMEQNYNDMYFKKQQNTHHNNQNNGNIHNNNQNNVANNGFANFSSQNIQNILPMISKLLGGSSSNFLSAFGNNQNPLNSILSMLSKKSTSIKKEVEKPTPIQDYIKTDDYKID